MKLVVFCLFTFSLTSSAHAITCEQIHQKSNPKKGKASCSLVSQSLGMGRASTETIYQCGKTTYKLITDEDFVCKVAKGK